MPCHDIYGFYLPGVVLGIAYVYNDMVLPLGGLSLKIDSYLSDEYTNVLNDTISFCSNPLRLDNAETNTDFSCNT